ncbi:MAG: response regulator transcription factor [Kouleothrix sp.]|jgi:DNA-binding NarL/FixJ family response regulator|nr:response regulator transcription factor [Kouleothrix sp.]
MTPPIRVLIVDDQSLIRAGIQALLSRKPDIVVVGQAANGDEALRQVAALDPDVVLMDIRMPGVDGVEATRRLVERKARAGIIILTTFQDDANVFSALAAGARGYLLKDTDHRALAEAIRIVAAGGALIHPEITAQVLREFSRLALPPPTASARPTLRDERLALLSERELAILRMLGSGRSNQEISARLAISVGTVKNHISNILVKLGVRDRTQAGLLAQQAGLAE